MSMIDCSITVDKKQAEKGDRVVLTFECVIPIHNSYSQADVTLVVQRKVPVVQQVVAHVCRRKDTQDTHVPQCESMYYHHLDWQFEMYVIITPLGKARMPAKFERHHSCTLQKYAVKYALYSF